MNEINRNRGWNADNCGVVKGVKIGRVVLCNMREDKERRKEVGLQACIARVIVVD